METGKPGRGRIYNSITETIGDTPLVRMARLPREAGVKADILLKLEFFNPISSVKDRIGVAMIEALEKQGIITPGKSTLVEPTSGNNRHRARVRCGGKGLSAHPCHAGIDVDRAAQDAGDHGRRGRAHRGAERHERRHRQGAGDHRRHAGRDHAAAIREPGQSDIHRRTTAEEIWNDTDGAVDYVISASAPAAPSPASARC